MEMALVSFLHACILSGGEWKQVPTVVILYRAGTLTLFTRMYAVIILLGMWRAFNRWPVKG